MLFWSFDVVENNGNGHHVVIVYDFLIIIIIVVIMLSYWSIATLMHNKRDVIVTIGTQVERQHRKCLKIL